MGYFLSVHKQLSYILNVKVYFKKSSFVFILVSNIKEINIGAKVFSADT